VRLTQTNIALLLAGFLTTLAVPFSASSVAQTATAEPPAQQQTADDENTGQPEANDDQPNWSADPTALARVTHDIKYMSSDEMAGRKPGTPGIKLCEDFIVAEFEKAGVGKLDNGSYFQPFEVRGTRQLVKDQGSLVLHGPDDQAIELEIGTDYQQLTSTLNNVKASGELVFVGYGITADKHLYDDYANIDVDGKIVVLLRMEPQQKNKDSVFNGQSHSLHAAGRLKASLARENGAAAVLLVNDMVTAPNAEKDTLVASERFGRLVSPFVQLKRSVLDKILTASPLISPTGVKLTNLADVEALIDSNLEPISQPIKGWSADMQAKFATSKVTTNNIIGVIEGEGPNANETIVIGGHYDHLGMGGFGSNAPGRKEIHNGADDNATGTAAVIELARRFQKSGKKPGRRLVFICFSAEEMGLLGASHYVENPLFPLEDTVMMVNFDMIGWLRNDELTLYGWNTAPEIGPAFDAANANIGLDLLKPERGFGGSDHLPFNAKEIPNTFIHSGLNDVYHTPEDDFELINNEGALKIIDYSENLIHELAAMESRPVFGQPKRFRFSFRFGLRLEDGDDDKVVVKRVSDGSSAEAAGVKAGDVIVEFAGEKVENRRNVARLIRKFKGDDIKLTVKRDGEKVELNAKLVDP
jgi:hypothetical protein